jgi:hypothetical protein
MCRKPRFIAVLAAVLAIAVTQSGGALRYAVGELSASTVRVNFTYSPSVNDAVSAEQPLFAFTTLPGTAFEASVSTAPADTNGRTIVLPVKTMTAGWMGRYYLQWISFDPSPLRAVRAASETFHGTILLRFGSPILRGLTAAKATLSGSMLLVPIASAPLAKSAAATALPALPFSTGLKVDVDSNGIYELRYETLAAAHVPLSAIASRNYRLFEKNREVPLYCSASPAAPLRAGDRILFYGRFLRDTNAFFTQYSNTNAYWLTWDNTAVGMRMATVSGEQRIDETQYSQDTADLAAHPFFDTVHLEEDNDIRWLGDIAAPGEMVEGTSGDSAIDNWYWGFVGTNELTTYTVTIPSPARSGSARLRISFMGLTSDESDPADHQMTVLINDNPAGARNTAVWDGQTPFVFVGDTFPASLLKAGKNSVVFTVRRRSYEDRSALNWIDVEYPRDYRATDDRIVFKSSDNAVGRIVQFELAGFSSKSIDLWDIAKYRVVTGFQVKSGNGGDRGLFTVVAQDSVATPSRYLAQTTARRRTPPGMKIDTLKTDWETLAGADYIAISSSLFRADLAPLLDAHRKDGMRAAFVDVNDIYNAFSGGIKDPESIRSFIRYLFSLSPDNPPRYLLLAGDCTHDCYKKNAGRTIVPTHLSRIPGWGPAADDDYFGTVQGDDQFADLCVGRLPAENSAQMKTMVDKTVKYLTTPERGFWRDNLLLASGWENEFTAFTDGLSGDVVGPRMNVLRMDADPQSSFYKDELTASNAMAAFINAGVYAVNFNGHGGGNIWSDSRFFGYNDLGKLHNGGWGASGRLPIVFSFTCLTGFFESVFYRSLGEEFVRTDANGAVCFYGASAYTSKKGNMLMDRLLLDHALDGTVATVGELTRFAEMSMLVRYGPPYLPLVRQYNLLGDPALPWRLTPDTLRLELAAGNLTSGDSLTVSGACAPVRQGTVSLIVKADNAVWNHDLVTVRNGSFARSFAVKANVKTATGLVRAYAWNDSGEVRGWAGFSKDTVAIRDLLVSPQTFAFGDSVEVSCALSLPANTAGSAAYCLYAIAAPGAAGIAYQGLRMEQDTAGRWRTIAKIPLTFRDDINRTLLVYFRVIADSISKESGVRSFAITGRPDLAFTNRTMLPEWRSDSLRVPFQVINKGNAAAPPFTVTLIWGDPAGNDTVATIRCPVSLRPAKAWDGQLCLPDTQGTLRFTGVINAAAEFQEISFDNNRTAGAFHLVFGDLSTAADTLSSSGRGLLLAPARNLSSTRRVFLFDNPLAPAAPLATASRWLTLIGDSLAAMRIGCRPPLGAADSLVWIFRSDSLPAGLYPSAVENSSGKLAVMRFDSLIGQWRCAGGAWGASPSDFTLRSGSCGPFAIAFLADRRPPSAQVFVYGRELTFVDYAAKDRPFDIMLADPSGIAPATVSLLLNRRPLASGKTSSLPQNGDLRAMTITAYPPPQQSIDSLTVIAEDLAGNRCEQHFAYMPGENFDIKFLSCHPNPFSLHKAGPTSPPQKVRFAFLLTDNATEAGLGVYTVTGKKIWSWRGANIIGYQEVAWDGRDAEGYRIGNGTYYTKLTAGNGRKTVKKLIRIAKLEGY